MPNVSSSHPSSLGFRRWLLYAAIGYGGLCSVAIFLGWSMCTLTVSMFWLTGGPIGGNHWIAWVEPFRLAALLAVCLLGWDALLQLGLRFNKPYSTVSGWLKVKAGLGILVNIAGTAAGLSDLYSVPSSGLVGSLFGLYITSVCLSPTVIIGLLLYNIRRNPNQ